MNKPLAVNDAQLAMVRTVAARLRPSVRDLFLRVIASELSDERPITDAAVRAAIDTVFSVVAQSKEKANA